MGLNLMIKRIMYTDGGQWGEIIVLNQAWSHDSQKILGKGLNAPISIYVARSLLLGKQTLIILLYYTILSFFSRYSRSQHRLKLSHTKCLGPMMSISNFSDGQTVEQRLKVWLRMQNLQDP